jgi:hypothetical protein
MAEQCASLQPMACAALSHESASASEQTCIDSTQRSMRPRMQAILRPAKASMSSEFRFATISNSATAAATAASAVARSCSAFTCTNTWLVGCSGSRAAASHVFPCVTSLRGGTRTSTCSHTILEPQHQEISTVLPFPSPKLQFMMFRNVWE